ncbi:MAG: DUF502 domain-containing protein [Cyanobacteria bacterium J06636_28]
MLKNFQQGFKNDLIAGLLVVIPLATTIWLTITVASWVIRALTRFPKQLNPFVDLHPALVALFNLGVGFAVPLLAILLIGLMARNIAGRWLLDFGERILQSIPLAGSVYKTLKQLLETVLQDTKTQFRRVVLVEYPRRGIWAIAFVTSSVTSMNPDSQMLSIFVPTTPNPTSGWYAVVPETDVVNLSISIEEAFKVLLSGGIVGPNLAEALVEQENKALLPRPQDDSQETENSDPGHANPGSSAKTDTPETRVELVNIDQPS